MGLVEEGRRPRLFLTSLLLGNHLTICEQYSYGFIVIVEMFVIEFV